MISTLSSKRSVCGFTLVELVLVVVVIGILSAIAFPNFTGVADSAKISKASATFGSLKASYATQKAIKKNGAVSVSDVVIGHDPSCTGSGTTRTCGNARVSFNSDPVPPPANWTCVVSDIAVATAC